MTALLEAGAVRTPTSWLVELLDLIGSQPAGQSPRQCPGHRDAHPSLSIDAGRGGAPLLHCFAGCSLRRISAALKLHVDVLHTVPVFSPAEHARRLAVTFPAVENRNGHPATRGYRLAAVHDYPPGHFLERWRARSGVKELRWWSRRPDGDVPSLLGTPLSDLPLYREPEIRMAVVAGEVVLLVESESSVDALRSWYATTWAGGADAVQIGRLVDVLGGHQRLVVVPDHDEAGLRALDRLARYGLAPHVVLPAEGEDARDLYERVGPAAFAEAVAARAR